MKRFLVRLGIISVVAVLGLIAIAQAQRGNATTPNELAAAASKPGASPVAGAATSPAAATPKPDPFSGNRLQAAPLQSGPSAAKLEGAGLFDATRNVPAGSDPRYAPSDPLAGRNAANNLNSASDRYQRPRSSPPSFGNESPLGGSSATAAASDTSDALEAPGNRLVLDPATAAPDALGGEARSDPRFSDANIADSRPSANSSRFSQPPQFDAQPPAGRDANLSLTPPSGNALRPDRGANSADRYARPGANEATSQEPAGFATENASPLRPTSSGQAAASPFDQLDRRPTGLTAGLTTADEGQGKPGAQQLEGIQSPSLTIEKFAPAEIQIGKPAMFEILIRNVGKVRAQSITLQDQVPKKTRLIGTTPPAEKSADGQLVWNLGALEPGAEQTVQLELMPTDEGEIGSVATLHFAASSSVRTVATRPELLIEVAAPKEVMIGDNAALSIKISNPGTGPATGVSIKELVPDAFSHPAGTELEYEVGDLKPGEFRELELVLTAAKAGPSMNVLTARGDGSLQAKQQTEMRVIAPGLEVNLSGPKRRFLEREATYTVSVTNPGTAAAREVELVTYLPKGMDFVKADNFGEYDPQTRAVRWSLEELPASESGTVSVTAMPVEAGEHKLLIEGTANQGLSAKQEQAVLVEGVAAILFQVVDVEDPIEINGETTYEIRVVNQGSKAATDVQLQAQLPPQMKALSAEGPTRHVIERDVVFFDKLPRLAPKADTTYRIRVQGLQAGDLRMRVQVVTNEITQPVVKEESTRVYADE